ncbi:MAG TPA: hypothetical protein VH062_13545 [Polyangiaceae bacterium]|nr:hypothetical protein [Polyangiaceae bacterium]
MILLPAGKTRTSEPMVSIRGASRSQRCLAFNSALSLHALKDVDYIAVDLHDGGLTFFPCESSTYKDTPAHRLIKDGGANTVGRAIYLPTSVLTEDIAPTGRYAATLARTKFTIRFPKPKR